MSAQTTNPRAKMPCMAYRGRPGHKERDSTRLRVRIVPMPVYQAEAAPRAKVRFELPVSRDLDYEDNLVPYWPDLEGRRPKRVNRLRAWLRRVRNHLSCFN